MITQQTGLHYAILWTGRAAFAIMSGDIQETGMLLLQAVPAVSCRPQAYSGPPERKETAAAAASYERI